MGFLDTCEENINFRQEYEKLWVDLRAALKVYKEAERTVCMDERPEIELKKAIRIYNEKLRELKKKYGIV